MSIYSIVVVNTAPGCGNVIEQQLNVTSCTSYIVRLASTSNAVGPFNVLVDNEIYYLEQTREQMLNGVIINLMCEAPDILIFTQEGFQLVTQDGNPIMTQQKSTKYMVSQGEINCPINPTLTQIIYSQSEDWFSAVRFYSDINLTIPFGGNNLYYTNSDLSCSTCWVIDNNGYTSNLGNPC